MSAVSFSGLSSGIDTASLVDGMVNAEKAQETPYQTQKSNYDAQNSIVGNLSTALASLGSLAQTMKVGSTELAPRTATASDSHVSVAVSSAAQPVVHTVRVEQTATTQVTASRTFASQDAGVLGAGSLTLGTGATAKTINYDATDSLASVASKINDANAGVSASLLYDGSTYRLMVTSTASGTAGVVPMTESGDALGVSDPANVKVPAKDAIVDIDGVKVTRSKNLIDDAIPGVTITANTAQAATDPDTTVTVALDQDGVAKKLQSFVTAYNVIASGLNDQLSYTGDGTTQKGQNTLFGDSTLRMLQSRLGSLMTSQFGGHTLSELGLQRDKTGVLSLDTTKLKSALAADPSIVTNVISTGGFAQQMQDLTDQYDRAGDGILAVKSAGLTAQSKMMQDSIDQIEDNTATMKTNLETQFAAMEKAISTLKSQQSYLSSILTSSA